MIDNRTAGTTTGRQHATYHNATSPRATQHREVIPCTAIRHARPALLLASLVCLMTLASCYDYEEQLIDDKMGNSEIQLAFALGQSNNNTRMSDDAVQAADNSLANFRGISELYLFPYITHADYTVSEPVSATMSRLGTEVLTPRSIASGTAELNNHEFNYSNYYMNVSVPYYTDAFLCYGFGPSNDPKTDGTIVANNIRAQKPQDISFSLKPIYDNYNEGVITIPAKATALVNYLNTIYRGGTWTAENAATKWDSDQLKDFRDLVFAANAYTAGSSTNILAMVKRLYKALYYSRSNADVVSILNAIKAGTNAANAALDSADPDQITALTSELSGYPTDLGLPDGSAYIEWNNGQYQVVTSKSNSSALAVYSVENLVYPPSLAYFANSRVMTHEKKLEGTTDQVRDKLAGIFRNSREWGTAENYVANSDGTAAHKSTTPNTDYVLDQAETNTTDFLFTGKSVTSQTGIVAIAKPLQYSVALLDVSVKVSGTVVGGSPQIITDNAEVPNRITVGANTFPITGIFIAGQKDVDWQFNTKATTSDSKTYTIYDSQVSGYMTTTVTDVNRTLAFETAQNEPVYVAIEFQNNSDIDFVTGDKKRIVPIGCKFYLIGKLDPRAQTGVTAPTQNHGKVFCQDQKTVVTFTVSDLKNAYNVIPDLALQEQLEFSLGVIDWKLSTPAGITLE